MASNLDAFSDDIGSASEQNTPSSLLLKEEARDSPSTEGAITPDPPLDREQATELAKKEGLPLPDELEEAIGSDGITISDLSLKFHGWRGGEAFRGPRVIRHERGSSEDFRRVLSSVASLDDATQRLKLKTPNTSPAKLPADLFPHPEHENDILGIMDMEVQVKYRDETISIPCSQSETLSEFTIRVAKMVGAEREGLKLWLLPGGGIYKDPFDVDDLLEDIFTKKTKLVKFIGRTLDEATRDDAYVASEQRKQAQYRGGGGGLRGVKTAAPARSRDWKQAQEESQYTFHDIQPLPYLPRPEKSKRFLERLASDPGIKASMRKHKFSVGLLTEMNPAEHTTHESRTLGLNRNRGEVIELRLRTDQYDGYRDYKVIRKTLCHELSHNVWGEHDRNFWDLTKQIEEEVERGDWKHGGHKLTDDEFYNPDDSAADADHADAGGWTGGEFVLGSLEGDKNNAGLSRREILAKAAMSRMEKKQDGPKKDEKK